MVIFWLETPDGEEMSADADMQCVPRIGEGVGIESWPWDGEPLGEWARVTDVNHVVFGDVQHAMVNLTIEE